ncbi:MAG TPA: BrnT family toxin [Gammaproteobacteria bacterium]|nr:BrnT family toxin [Gammaproteobacteria bacterium]
MEYRWDSIKARINIGKHGVAFADAVIALEDDLAITIPDPDSEDEERFISMGSDVFGRVLITVFTLRGDEIRIISSRKASNSERERYKGAI